MYRLPTSARNTAVRNGVKPSKPVSVCASLGTNCQGFSSGSAPRSSFTYPPAERSFVVCWELIPREGDDHHHASWHHTYHPSYNHHASPTMRSIRPSFGRLDSRSPTEPTPPSMRCEDDFRSCSGCVGALVNPRYPGSGSSSHHRMGPSREREKMSQIPRYAYIPRVVPVLRNKGVDPKAGFASPLAVPGREAPHPCPHSCLGRRGGVWIRPSVCLAT